MIPKYVSLFSIAVINAMTKATYRRKDLFGLMVPGGKSLS